MSDDLDDWVYERHPDAVRLPRSGQRRVYHLADSKSALKVWAVVDPTQHERHVREVSKLGAMSDAGLPRIVAHLSQVEIGRQLYAMYQEEWLEAPSIHAQLGELPLDELAFELFLETALETLAQLHSAAVVHRDVSLGNVLWDGRRAYVVDLGLAKYLDHNTLTSTGQPAGHTPLTASPEQLQGFADLQESTDVYSLGIVAFHVATGRHPFIRDGEQISPGQLIARQMDLDFQRKLPSHAAPLREMLEPVAIFRPQAKEALKGLGTK